MTDEKRVTSNTGGAKGVKLARFDLIPSEFLWLLAEVYGHGAQKYDEDNYLRGYDWRLSFGALQRHLHEFWMGEDYDGESGLPHLVHAAWHCITLYVYMSNPKYARHDTRRKQRPKRRARKADSNDKEPQRIEQHIEPLAIDPRVTRTRKAKRRGWLFSLGRRAMGRRRDAF